MENDYLDIDASKLTPQDALELRAALEFLASGYRAKDRPAPEGFCIAVASVLESAARAMAGAAGETLSESPIQPVSGVDLSTLSAGDCVLAGGVFLRAAEAAYKAGREPLGDCFTALADGTVEAGKVKARNSTG